jgi:hypothetical protein
MFTIRPFLLIYSTGYASSNHKHPQYKQLKHFLCIQKMRYAQTCRIIQIHRDKPAGISGMFIFLGTIVTDGMRKQMGAERNDPVSNSQGQY